MARRSREDSRRTDARSYVWAVLLSCLLAACLSVPGIERLAEQQRQAWDKDKGPTVPHDTFPADCSICHKGDNWHTLRDDFSFDHAKETGVALKGAHKFAQCLRCHNDRGPVSQFSARGCAGCHEDFHRGRLGNECERCHNEMNWNPQGQLAAHARTRFPLIGAHIGVACWSCHPNAQSGQFVGLDTRCESCHTDDLARAKSPDHIAAGFVSDCQRCHRATAWDGSGFIHPRFALTGAHMGLDCNRCHTTPGNFAGLSSSCVSCHEDDRQRAREPDHLAQNFSTKCDDCHSTISWEGARFNHAGITTNCASCHQDDFNRTTNPNHVAQNFSTKCEDCHNTNTWQGARFNHTGITNNCQQCHLTDYNNTTHAARGFPTTCESWGSI